jgi:hypothetical protein
VDDERDYERLSSQATLNINGGTVTLSAHSGERGRRLNASIQAATATVITRAGALFQVKSAAGITPV